MSDYNADAVITALGGVANVVELEPCITRVRIRVVDPEQVDVAGLEALGALGVKATGRELQVVFGPQAEAISDQISARLPSTVSQPGGLDPIESDPNSRAATLILGTDSDDEEATGE